MSRRPGALDPVAALARALGPDGDVPILLAVSGGPDSTALLHACAALGRAGPVHVATVDHGLRPEGRAEAEEVAAACAALGLPHSILIWTDGRSEAGLQEAARIARYRLLAAQARTVGAASLLTAHTLDDQAETVLLRLAAGSGIEGLAGMAATRLLAPGLRLLRPFLDVSKRDLVAWCDARGLAYRTDPSNADPRFARARLRTIAAGLAREGLTPLRLHRLAQRAARDEAALRDAALTALVTLRRPAVPGEIRLDGRGLAALPEAVSLRVMRFAFAEAGCSGPVRLERLERLLFEALLPALRVGDRARGTLAGLLIEAGRDGWLRVQSAPARRSPKP